MYRPWASPPSHSQMANSLLNILTLELLLSPQMRATALPKTTWFQCDFGRYLFFLILMELRHLAAQCSCRTAHGGALAYIKQTLTSPTKVILHNRISKVVLDIVFRIKLHPDFEMEMNFKIINSNLKLKGVDMLEGTDDTQL